MKLTRINSIGMRFTIERENFGRSIITIHGTSKSIVVNMDIDEISQAWYNWQVKGFLIQRAFSRLNDDEREFLMSGISSAEWTKIFSETGEE